MKKLGFGFMRLPLLDPEDQKSVDIEQLKKMVDLFMARGFTYFDTAYMYHGGDSEGALKASLVDRYPRGSFTVTDKLPTMHLKKEGDNERFFAEQLERTGAGYFDYYWLHNLNSSTYPLAQKFDSFAFIAEKKREGKVLHTGFSFHDSPELLDKILSAHPEVEFVQLQINYLDWDDAGIQSRACWEVARRHGKQVVVMEPVKGGTLAKVPDEAAALFDKARPGASAASWGIRFAASLDGVMVVLSGMSDMAQTLDNTSFMSEFEPMTDPEFSTVRKAADIIHGSVAIPCTGCRYCVDGCPKKIPIPGCFALYNANHSWGRAGFGGQRMYYNNLCGDGHGKASDCISCGQCEKACPQHIKVRDWLKKVAGLFEAQR